MRIWPTLVKVGFKIFRSFILVRGGRVDALKEKLKVEGDIGPMLRGFVGGYRLASCKKVQGSLIGWLRRRLRAIQVKLWKKPAKLLRRLR